MCVPPVRVVKRMESSGPNRIVSAMRIRQPEARTLDNHLRTVFRLPRPLMVGVRQQVSAESGDEYQGDIPVQGKPLCRKARRPKIDISFMCDLACNKAPC